MAPPFEILHGRDEEPLRGWRLLLVEDNFLAALELDSIIRELGAEVVGPFGVLKKALDAVHREIIDGAVLDLRLDGELSYPVADILLERGRPIVLVTGGVTDSMPEKYRQLPCLLKPFDYSEFAKVAMSVFPKRG
jgi:DNA-binding LytR/AlgR family response regulator